MKKLIFFGLILVAFLLLLVRPASAAQQECWDLGASTNEIGMSTQNRHAQQYTPQNNVTLVSTSFNIYGNPSDSGDFVHWISETSGSPALPTGVIVAGSLVNKPSNAVPDKSVGVGQAFVCADQPTINHTMTYGAPITLIGGTTYALIIYHDSQPHASVIGFKANDTGLIPGTQGLSCVGSPCVTHTGWALNTFGGDNWDIVFNLDNAFIDPAQGSATDGTIDDQVMKLREYLKLDGDLGGMIFGLMIVAFIFALAIVKHIPFIVVAMFNTLVIATLARAEIMPPWILLTLIAIAGMALVFKLASLSKGQTDEG